MSRPLLLCLPLVVLGGSSILPRPDETEAMPAPVPLRPDHTAAPMFVPNDGQWAFPARFVARCGASTVFLEDDGFLLSTAASSRGVAVRLRMETRARPVLSAEQPLAGQHTYLLGSDPARWRTVPRFGAVRYRTAWPEIDVLCRGDRGHFEYDVVVGPGGDLRAVEFVVEGADGLRLDRDGELVAETAFGPLRQPRPPTFVCDADGSRRMIVAGYELRGPDRFGFCAPDWDGQGVLLIDPGVFWSTLIGGAGFDEFTAIAVDRDDRITVAGYTANFSYPVTTGAWSTTGGGYDAVVTRLDPSQPVAQQLVYSTYFGGSGDDQVQAMAIDAAGIVTIAGSTDSPDLPRGLRTWRPQPQGGTDAFLARLDPARSAANQLQWSTYLGGAADDWATGVVVDELGVVTVAGSTASSGFPTTPGAWSTSYGGLRDGFVARLGPTRPVPLQLLWSTFVGGSNMDDVHAIAQRGQTIAIAGRTWSADFPSTPGAFDRAASLIDGYVALFDPAAPTAQQLRYASFVGGSQNDHAYALHVDAAGVLTVAGATNSPDFPTTPGAFDRTRNIGADIFVLRLDPLRTGTQQLLYGTYLGGAWNDYAYAVQADALGAVTVAGCSDSQNFPVTAGAFDPTWSGLMDVVVARLDPSLSGPDQLVASTFIGGAYHEWAMSLATESTGITAVAGLAGSPSYPTTPDAWRTPNGHAFVTRMDLLPDGVTAFGRASPGCGGRSAIGTTTVPRVGNAAFRIDCSNAAPGASGMLIGAGTALPAPLVLLGVEVWIDPSSPLLFTRGLVADSLGVATVPMPVPASSALAGLSFYLQAGWFGPSAPAPCPPAGVAMSRALSVTVLP